MSSSDLSPEAIKLLNRMTGPPLSHPSFTGEPIDLAQIDPLSLGDLWTIAHATNRWENNRPIKSLAAETASSILKLGEKMEPAFRGAAARDYLDFLSDKLEREPARASGYVADFDWKEACFCLTRCIDLSFDGLGAAAKRFLAAADWQVMPHLAVALARLVDDEFGARALEKLAADLADSPFLVQELRTITALDLRANLAVAEVAQVNYPELQEADPAISGGHYRLSDIPAYVAFAEEGLKEAAARVRKIHNGEVPYASDKAFTLKDRDVIARLVRVALDRDAAWLPPVLDELFRKVSLAPTAAKSLPSQSVSIALGHAVEAFPTPEAVATLRGVLAIIRHAGVQKKLKRNLNGAERGLADRPEVALRLLDGQQISKAQLKTLARCLEAGFASHMSLKYEDWRARLAGHPQGKALTRSLIWRILDSSGGGVGVLPVIERSEVRLQDVSGSTVSAAPDSRIMLWHPSVATEAERNAWRDRIADLQIKQPFKQAFREHYVLLADELSETNTAMFSGHGVSIVPFLGLARQERWKLEYEALTRS
ncbi:MAG TPA: DUF4132 domain-containing protein, partial [Methylovirgula sp.]|nr:DUF4132 domain-containing protein [Methylovirgula sp.]